VATTLKIVTVLAGNNFTLLPGKTRSEAAYGAIASSIMRN
jgi:hypothetical protein